MKSKIRVRYLKKNKSIYLKTDLFSEFDKKDYKRLTEYLDKIISNKNVNRISSLDWRALKYISEKYSDFKIIYIAYHVDAGSLGRSKKKIKYRKLFINDCDTWSFDCLWFAGFHPAKYNYSYKRACIACSKGSGELYILNKKDTPLYSLSDTLIENIGSREIKKTKSHFISPHEIKKILELEPERELVEASTMISLILKTKEYNKINEHAEKLIFVSEKIKIDTTKIDKDKHREIIERNILSEIYLLYRDIKNYFDSRCRELNSSPAKLDKKAFDFFDNEIKKIEPVFNSSTLYSNTVHNKNIAIICPGPHIEINYLNLEKFDVVVFFNETKQVIPGKKIIVNIAPTLTEKGLTEKDLSGIDHITSSLRQPTFFRDCDRVLRHPRKFLFNTCPAGLQRFLYDLLAFSPKRVKVYGATLHLKVDGSAYRENYHSRIENLYKIKLEGRKNTIRHSGFNVHDPLANFYFLKYLKKREIIECDLPLHQILELEPYQYLEKLFYGKNHV